MAQVRTLELVDADSVLHRVTEDAYALDLAGGRGSFLVTCGRRVLPHDMGAGPRSSCQQCRWGGLGRRRARR